MIRCSRYPKYKSLSRALSKCPIDRSDKVATTKCSTSRKWVSWFNELTQSLGNLFPEAKQGHVFLFLNLCLHRLDSTTWSCGMHLHHSCGLWGESPPFRPVQSSKPWKLRFYQCSQHINSHTVCHSNWGKVAWALVVLKWLWRFVWKIFSCPYSCGWT